MAQEKAILKSVYAKENLFENLQAISPFSEGTLKANSSANIPAALVSKKLLNYDAKILESQLKANPSILELAIPGIGENWELQLEVVNLYSDNFFVNSPKGVVTDGVDLGKFYRGIVKGKENSLVSVAVFNGEIQAMISIDDHNYTLGKLIDINPREASYILYDEGEIDKEYESFCSTQDKGGQTLDIAKHRAGTKSTDKCVNVYLEADYDVYQNKGSVAGVTNYLSAVFNEVATLYANENLTVKISEIFVWSSPSPYTGASSTTMLNDFRSVRPNFNGDIGHLIDLNPSNGGIAYVDVLCNTTYNYAYSGIDPTYKSVPTYSWTIEVITHEIGHNLGSPHTHDCSWPGGPIDNCQPPSGLCGTGPTPTNGGTIMSYCHLTSHGINFNNGFGPLPGDLIRNRVSNASCLTSCEASNVCSVPSGITASNATTTSFDVSWNAVSSANSYDLRYREQGTTPWTTVSVSGTSYSITGLTPLTTYDVQLQSDCGAETSGYSTSQNFSTLSDQLTYCGSQGNDASYEWISSVKIGTFTKTSGSSQYSDFTANVITLKKQTSTSITLTPAFASSTYNEYWMIWADLNQDGDFTDAGEKLFDSGSLSSSAVNGSISIPASASLGNTRLRVSMKYNAAQTGPCESFGYGEVEDYTLNVEENIPDPCLAPGNLAITSTTETSISLSWTASGSNESSYVLEHKSQGSSTWNSQTISGTSATVSGLNHSSAYDFRVKANCGSESSPYSATASGNTDTPAPCNAPGNLQSSAVGSTSMTITWNAVSNANTYNVDYKTSASSSWTSTSSSTNSINLSGLSANTSYDVRVASVCTFGTSGWSSTLTESTTNAPIVYCGSSGNNSGSEWIQRVQIANINNNSGSNGGYADFTAQTLQVTAGNSYSFTLTPGFSSGLFGTNTAPEYWKVWIDYNHDGDFTDAGELAYDAGGTSTAARSGTITIPANTAATTTRMRVSMKYNGAQSSCENFSYGEVEDYTVNIQPNVPQPCNAPTGVTANNATSSSFTVSWNAVSNANQYLVEYRVSGGNWSSLSVTGTSTTISGLAANTSYQARVSSDCGSESSSPSAAVSISTLDEEPEPVNYCASSGNNSSDEWIKKITVGSFSNNSGNNGGYGDFTGSTVALAAGSSVSISLEPGFSSGLFGTNSYPEYWKVWIDYNKDGDFNDAGELAFDAGSTSSSTVNGTINVPSSAAGSTRMRVSMKYNAAQSSCENFGYGEVEDYTVSFGSAITTSINTNEIVSFESLLAPNPSNGNTSVRLTGLAQNKELVVRVLDLEGRQMVETVKVYGNGNTSQSIKLDLREYSAGIYLVEISSEGEAKQIHRLVKN